MDLKISKIYIFKIKLKHIYRYNSHINNKMSFFFKNNTELPIMVETWVSECDGLSKLVDLCILPQETKEIKSLTGEWYIHRMFQERYYGTLWEVYAKTQNMPLYLGKFRKDVSYNGEIIWLDTNDFTLHKENDVFIWNKIK